MIPGACWIGFMLELVGGLVNWSLVWSRQCLSLFGWLVAFFILFHRAAGSAQTLVHGRPMKTPNGCQLVVRVTLSQLTTVLLDLRVDICRRDMLNSF